MALSCTEQLQKWHHRSKKRSIPIVPLNKIKLNSAKMKKRDGKTVISPADPDQNYFKRDVPLIVKKLKEQLKKEKSSVSQHLHYKCTQRTAFALSDHIYCNASLFNQNIINIDNT